MVPCISILMCFGHSKLKTEECRPWPIARHYKHGIRKAYNDNLVTRPGKAYHQNKIKMFNFELRHPRCVS